MVVTRSIHARQSGGGTRVALKSTTSRQLGYMKKKASVVVDDGQEGMLTLISTGVGYSTSRWACCSCAYSTSTHPARPSPTLSNASGLGAQKVLHHRPRRPQISNSPENLLPSAPPFCPHAQSLAAFRHVAIIGAQGRFAPASAVAGESPAVQAAAAVRGRSGRKARGAPRTGEKQ